MRWPQNKALTTSATIFEDHLPSFRDSLYYEGILEKYGDNYELRKTICSLISHASLHWRLIKLRESDHDTCGEFKSLNKELRAAAVDPHNLGHTKLSADQVP